MVDFESIVSRKPDFVIGGSDNPYMNRWYLLPRNDQFNVCLHQFLRSDDDRALHDHPWASFSLVLAGIGIEHVPGGFWRFGPGAVIERMAEYSHRIEVIEGPIWTLFVTGPKVREWGFHCPNGWVHWQKFVSTKDSGEIGRGCD